MSYTGEVTRGGAPDVRETAALRLTKLSVGPMDNNAYLLECRETGERALVDAADDAGTLLALIGTGSLGQVVTTHQHRDHWQALAEVVSATGARTAAGRPDAAALPVPVDLPLDDGDRVRVGQVELEVIALVGHTPGSVALLYDDPGGHPLRAAHRRRRAQDLRPAAGRHLVLPRARQRLDAGGRARVAGRVARPRLVTGRRSVSSSTTRLVRPVASRPRAGGAGGGSGR